MDVGSRNGYPAGKLSNFTAFQFMFDGVECASMEGLLQSFKYKNINSQQNVCSLVGIVAKRAGSGRNRYWKQHQTLYWKGHAFRRNSKAYQILLDEAYNALYASNEAFRKCLADAGDAIFTHSIGRNDEKETVLTEREFCKRLQYLKDFGLIPRKKG